MTSIQAVQPNNIFRVNQVNLFENRNNGKASAEQFNSGLFSQQTNNNYNLNHPLVKGSQTQARSLDLLA